MARARNIKPSFFVSEKLADQCPLGRLLFIGLWTLADFKGDLEWKERTIKVQLLPFDNCSVKELAINLDKSGLIQFYSRGDQIFVHIPGFEKHQHPHPNEKKSGSDVPGFSDKSRQVIDFSTLTINHDLSRAEQNYSTSDRAPSPIPLTDSLLLIPDSPIPIPDCPSPPANSVSSTAASAAMVHVKQAKPKITPSSRDVWERYSQEYQNRYGATPVRNATVNGQMAQFVKRIGAEESPEVAAFYVHHNQQFYVQQMHPVGLLLKDAEKLRTEWATGRRMSNTQARGNDKTSGNAFVRMLENQGGNTYEH